MIPSALIAAKNGRSPSPPYGPAPQGRPSVAYVGGGGGDSLCKCGSSNSLRSAECGLVMEIFHKGFDPPIIFGSYGICDQGDTL